MPKKQPRVPELREPRPNREQRRHQQPQERPEETARARDRQAQAEILERGPQDVTSVRAKNSGHKKKTADNWNQ